MTTHTAIKHAHMATVAPTGTPCGVLCFHKRPAVHVLTESLPVAPAGTPLCAYHSPFDIGSRYVAPAKGVSLAKVYTPFTAAMLVGLAKLDAGHRAGLLDSLPGHAEGMGTNDMITLRSFFKIAAL